MKRSGCSLVSFGIESADADLLKHMGKKLAPEKIGPAVQLLKDAGLATSPYYLIGLPWETNESVEKTIRLAIELDTDYAGIFLAAPFPGTWFFEYALQHDLIEDRGLHCGEGFQAAYRDPIARGHYLSLPAIKASHRKAIRSFFLRPKFALNTIRKIQSPHALVSFAKAAYFALRG